MGRMVSASRLHLGMNNSLQLPIYVRSPSINVRIDKISIRDMVNMTLKTNDVFGIEGYNLPYHGITSKGIQNSIPKGKGKNFAEE
jgi:hypothetical protein